MKTCMYTEIDEETGNPVLSSDHPARYQFLLVGNTTFSCDEHLPSFVTEFKEIS